MTNPMRTYQLLVAPSECVVDTHDNPGYEARIDDVDGQDPCKVITVQALSESTIVVPDGYTMLEVLEIVPQDFSVGDVVYMEWLCQVNPVGGSDEGMCLQVSSIAGWDKEIGNIGWHEPQPIEGEKKYLVTLPAQYCHHLRDGGLSWTKDAVATVLRVL